MKPLMPRETLLLLSLLGLALCAACSSVALPEENYYRLAVPRSGPVEYRSPHVVRVEGFGLDANLSRDRLLVAKSPVLLQAYEFHRWISPLDELIRDAVQRDLSRTGAFAEVKGPSASPGETLVLSGRVLDFQQVAAGERWIGKATLVLRLADARDDRIVYRREFTQSEPMRDETPQAAAVALGKATRAVLDRFLEGCDKVGVFGPAAKPGK